MEYSPVYLKEETGEVAFDHSCDWTHSTGFSFRIMFVSF